MSDVQPLYARVKSHILGHIRSGAWEPGARVPSENEIVAQFRISRMTAHRALRELTADGYLARVPGVGTFVKERTAASSLMELRDIAGEIAGRGHTHSARVLTREAIEADEALAGEFETAPGARLFHLVAVHAENGTPVQFEDRYVNPAAVPDFLDQDFTRQTPTALLLSRAPVDELEHTVEAIRPSARMMSALGIGPVEPCLSLHRRSWSGGRVATVATLVYPGSRASLKSRYSTTPKGTLR